MIGDEYIKREDAISLFKGRFSRLDVIKQVRALPSEDVAPVVRCKDCVSWEAVDGDKYQTCALTGKGMDANGFCSNAERRKERR